MNNNETDSLPWENEPAPAGRKASKVLNLVPASEGETPNLDLLPRADAPAVWREFKAKLFELKDTAETLTVTEITDAAGMAKARETRLQIRQIRIAVEHERKTRKEAHLKAGQQVDADAKAIREACEAYENRMQLQEEFGDRERERLALELGNARRSALLPYLLPGANVTTDLAALSEKDWESTLSDAKDLHDLRAERERKAAEEAARVEEENRKAAEEQKAEAARQAEADRLERVRLKEENERVLAENARIREEEEKARKLREAEAEAERKKRAAEQEAERQAAARREEELRKEREAIAAEQAKERQKAEAQRREQEEAIRKANAAAAAAEQEKARLEAAERMRVAQEAAAKAKAKADAEEAARKAASAPDRQRLQAYADAVEAVAFPKITGTNAAQADKVAEKMVAVVAWLRKTAEAL